MKIRIFLTAALAAFALFLAACGDPQVIVVEREVVATPTPAPVPAATSTPKPEEDNDRADSQEGAAQPAMSVTAARLRLLNLTSVPTATLEADAARASSRMANRRSDVLAVIYPIGSHIADVPRSTWSPDGNPEHGKPFSKFERVISQEQVESTLGEIETWMASHNCIDAEHRNHQLAEYRLWMEGGADASSQITLCHDVRLVMMAIPDGMPDWDLHQFLVHELYHAFQHDLEERQCQEVGRMMFVEGAAQYFAYFVTEMRFPDRPAVPTLLGNALQDHQQGDGIDEGSSTAAAAALRLMVERGDLSHNAIMDGSLFHSCARSGEFGPDVPTVRSARVEWPQIEESDGDYQFAAAVVGRSASAAPAPTATTSSSAAATGPFNLLVAGCDDDRLEISSSVRQALAGLGFTQCSTPFGILLAAAADMPGPVVTYAAKIVAEVMDQDQDGYADHAELAAMLKYPGGVDDQRAWLAMPTKHGYNEGAGRDHMANIGYEIEIPAWWIWGDAGRNGDFSAGLDDHAKAVIWEEIDHFVHQFGLSHVFPGEFGVQSWDSLLAQETKRAACEWWQHPENDCPGKPRESDGPPGGCADPGCDVVEFFHQVHTMLAGMQPGWLGIGFPTSKQELEARLSPEFNGLMDDPRFPLLRRPLKGDYPLADESVTDERRDQSLTHRAAQPMQVESVSDSRVDILNLSEFSSDLLRLWTAAAEAMVSNVTTRTLTVVYPVGSFKSERAEATMRPFFKGPEFEVVMSSPQMGNVAGAGDEFLQSAACMPDEDRQDYVAGVKEWLELGGGSQAQDPICPNTRLVLLSIDPERLADVERTQFVWLHELYHAFQQDLRDCRDNEHSLWSIEGAANYFAHALQLELAGTPEKFTDVVLERTVMEITRHGSRLEDPGVAEKGVAALLFMVQAGLVEHASILNAELFQDCRRTDVFASENPDLAHVMTSWHRIEVVGPDQTYQFRRGE